MIVKVNKLSINIGEYRIGIINDHNGDPHEKRFLVLEEVTEHDYINQCLISNNEIGIILDDDRFYRISID